METFQNPEQEKLIQLINILDLPFEGENTNKAQEIVFILKYLGEKFSQKFKYEYFRPYSFELDLQLDELLKHSNQVSQNGNNDSKSDESLQNKEPFELLIKKLSKIDAETLRVIATIFYMKSFDYEEEQIKKKLHIIMPDYQNKFETAISKSHELEKNAT